MEDNNVSVVEAEKPIVNKPSIGARIKEWFRKEMVALKRKPQYIALLVVLIASVYNLLCLATYSHAIVTYGSAIDWLGLLVFVNTLFSILVFVAFLNSFPKLKPYGKKTVVTLKANTTKININLVMYAVTFVFLIVMLVCEVMYIHLLNNWLETQTWYAATDLSALSTSELEQRDLFLSSRSDSYVHIVLLAISIAITALIPLYSQLICRINTSKELDSAVENMQEIDLAAED